MAATQNPYGLPALQWRFVQEYLITPVGSIAYQRAGYQARANSAEAAASRLLRSAKVSHAVKTEQAKRAAKLGITQEAVLHEIAVLQHSSIEHYSIDDTGNVCLSSTAPPDAMRAVASLKKKIIHTETGVIYETELKLWNKPASLRMGGEHLGLFKGTEQAPPDIHVHVHTARARLADRVAHLAARHAEDATNGH